MSYILVLRWQATVGKYYTLTADTLSQIYPRWEDFNKVRKEQNPEGRFMTPYMRKLLWE